MTKALYLFSGLGADERVFQRLDFSGFTVVFIQWLVPRDQETMEQYAARLLDQIPTTKPTLIGLSFGGMIAVEVARLIDTERVILISSAKTKSEIPIYYRLAGKLNLHKLLPTALLKRSNFITDWFFGVNSAFEKQLLKQILADTDPAFLKWAIDKVVKWKNQAPTPNLFHIHGTSDRILPAGFVASDAIVKDGGHFMIGNKAQDLNQILRQQI
jgi:pimeloyl-ACP methyl ester carboxylesterase